MVETVNPFAEDAALLTSRSFDGAELALAADVVPAGQSAGDGFEFAHEPSRLQFAVFDAMGSDASSAELVAAVSTEYRRALRDHAGDTDHTDSTALAATATRLDRTVADRSGADAYCTGVLGELDPVTGELRIFNAGHPFPLLLNLPTREYQPLATAVNLPFGLSVLLDEAPAPVVNSHQLRPGQVVAVYTDGVTEARSSDREFLGERRFAETLIRLLAGGLCPAEAVSQMMRFLHVLQDGSLRDDATLFVAQWRGQLPLDA